MMRDKDAISPSCVIKHPSFLSAFTASLAFICGQSIHGGRAIAARIERELYINRRRAGIAFLR